MSYTIKRYGQPNIILPNGSINTETSVALIGKNYASYGQLLDQNSMTLLQNSASITPPANPQYGQLWWNAANNVLNVYTGVSFKTLGSIVASGTAPLYPAVGDCWFNTTRDSLSVYNGSAWVLIGPSVINGTGTLSTTIRDTAGLDHLVVEILVNSAIVGIVSKDPVFVPNVSIPGFSTVGPGYNVANVLNSTPQYYNGTATNSLALNGLGSNAFMSSITNTGTSGNIAVSNDAGLTTGLLQNFSFYNSYNDGVIENSSLSGNILIDLNISGNITNVASFYGSNGNVVFSSDVTANTVHANTIYGNTIVGNVVKQVNTGTGLTGGPITNVGTISLSKAVSAANGVGGTIGGVIPDGNTIVMNTNGVISAIGDGTGTVKTVNTGTGLTGGPITVGGTIALLPAVSAIGGVGGIIGGVIPDGVTVTLAANGVISTSAVSPSTNLRVNSLGVGAAASGIAGEIRATNNITAYYSSDERLKENFNLIDDPLEKAKLIRGYFFDWTQQFIDDHGGEDGVYIRKHNVGVKAQEVQRALPEVVTERSDGYLGVRYEMLIPLLFECINALVEKIESNSTINTASK